MHFLNISMLVPVQTYSRSTTLDSTTNFLLVPYCLLSVRRSHDYQVQTRHLNLSHEKTLRERSLEKPMQNLSMIGLAAVNTGLLVSAIDASRILKH